MRKKIEYTWYVKPLDAQTNQTIALIVDEENFCSGSYLWRCDVSIVLSLIKSIKTLGLKFKIFNQQGNGKIREIPLSILNKRKRKRKTAS